jgi:two-component system, NtrC family, response regulator AtoC
MIPPVALSETMREVVRLGERVAATDANVLITGESGAGKDELALFIHSSSRRATGPLVKIDCATLPPDLLEAELFGYEAGAFTGATEAKPGRLEAAHHGTMVLDEITHLSVGAQAKLLRLIEMREFERLGARRTIKVDARLIALTNVDLEDAVRLGTFREDLFYRLNVVRIRVPPLRERGKDVPQLVRVFLKDFAARHGRKIQKITPAALQLLQDYDFPGNVRELANTIERAVIVSRGDEIDERDIPETVRATVAAQTRGNRRLTLGEVEEQHIKETLVAAGGNKTEAARMLGISRKNLYERLARMGEAAVRGQKSDGGEERSETDARRPASEDGGESMNS